jgi:hypothetical protein
MRFFRPMNKAAVLNEVVETAASRSYASRDLCRAVEEFASSARARGAPVEDVILWLAAWAERQFRGWLPGDDARLLTRALVVWGVEGYCAVAPR